MSYKCPHCNKLYDEPGFCEHGAKVTLKKLHNVANPILTAPVDPESGKLIICEEWTIKRVNDKSNLGNDIFDPDDGLAHFSVDVDGKKIDPNPPIYHKG